MSLNSKFQQFKNLLYSKDYNKRLLFYNLKTEYTLEEQRYIIAKLPKMFLSLVYKNPFAKKNQDLGKGNKSYIKSFNTEINWMILLFTKYHKQVNNFLAFKTTFESSILLGKYDEAEHVLNSIKKISFSFWGLENKFLLVQLQKGLKYNFELKDSSKTKKNVAAEYFFLNHFFSYKVEDDVSYFSYENSLELSLQDVDPVYVEYINYRLNPTKYNYQKINDLLYVTSNFSIIDKYLLCRDLFYYLSINESESENLNKIKLNNLDIKINDELIKKSISFKNLSFQNDSILYNQKYLSLIDNYTIGNYTEVIINGKKFLAENPSCFSVLELYIKSHIYLKKKVEKITVADSLINNILIQSDIVIRKKKKSNDSLIELLTIANSISTFDLSKELLSFIANNYNEEFTDFSLKKDFIYSKFYDPVSYSIFDSQNQNKYLSSFKNNITANFFLQISNRKFSNLNDKIPLYRRNFQIAQKHYIDENYKECYLILENLIPKIKEINYLYEFLLIYLFDSYVAIKMYNKAINLFVKTFLNKPQLAFRIKIKELGQILIKLKWKNIDHSNINFPIFMFLVDLETHTKFIAYDLFMRTQNESLPSKLFKNIETEYSLNKIYFLKNVCNEKVISKKVRIFKNSNDVLKERIAICQVLLKSDKENFKEYNEEISEITQILTVKQRVKEVDESKIYVDEEGILNSELDEVKKSFNRYIKITELLNKSEISSTSFSVEALIEILNRSSKNLRKSDLQIDLFIELYLEIRNKFLFSNKFGLEYYISQRIRHGTIIGQIRKQFKEYNLVTTKNSKTNEYLSNKYWLNNLENLNKQQQLNLDVRLKEFSGVIDYVINELKNEFIQIKTEDKKTAQKGWFSFEYSNKQNDYDLQSIHYYKFRDIDNLEDFVRGMFKILWVNTEFNLENIRKNISVGIKRILVEELDNFEKDLKKIIPDSKTNNKIYRNIADCRTKVQDDLDYISRWFNKSKNYAIDFTIDDALATSLQIIKNIISPSNFEIKKESNVKCVIKGYYFTHFVDLVKIFLTNIYDYNKENNLEDIYPLVTVSEESKLLTLIFSNELSKDENLMKLKNKTDSITKDLESSNYIQTRKEGKSGFYKANNIIKNVFRNSNNEITLVLTKKEFSVKCTISLQNLII